MSGRTRHGDRDELVELVGRYANMPDAMDWDDLPRTVLCDEVTFDFSTLGTPPVTIGREAWCRASRRLFSGWSATHHAVTNHLIEVDGDRATIHAHVRVEHWAPPEVAAGGPACWLVVGFYDDIAVRTPDGWRLRAVTLTATHQENASLLAAVREAGPARPVAPPRTSGP